jgi:hypothetical protein
MAEKRRRQVTEVSHAAQIATLLNVPTEAGICEGMIMAFDWHSDPITRTTPLDKHYRNTQNVRRFLISQCGKAFKFDRPFMAWNKARPRQWAKWLMSGVAYTPEACALTLLVEQCQKHIGRLGTACVDMRLAISGTVDIQRKPRLLRHKKTARRRLV